MNYPLSSPSFYPHPPWVSLGCKSTLYAIEVHKHCLQAKIGTQSKTQIIDYACSKAVEHYLPSNRLSLEQLMATLPKDLKTAPCKHPFRLEDFVNFRKSLLDDKELISDWEVLKSTLRRYGLLPIGT